jgi:hypothetical protein
MNGVPEEAEEDEGDLAVVEQPEECVEVEGALDGKTGDGEIGDMEAGGTEATDGAMA